MKKIFLIAFLSSFYTYSQSKDSLFTKFNELGNKLYSKPINYLNNSKTINEYKKLFTGTNLESFYLQLSSSFYAASGNQFEAKKKYWLSKGKNIDSARVISNDLSSYNDIYSITKDQRIIMINENHYFPEHRVFTTSLLDSLFKQGFKYLALEDLANSKTSINTREVLFESDGYYINEVMYAEMVRKAKKIGFKLISYDNNDAWNISERDSLGAMELKKVFNKNPNTKMVIHCGFGHVDKHQKVLAYFINKELGINPLTISQTIKYPISSAVKLEEPKIVMNHQGNESFDVKTDIQILHPNYNYSNRPSYLFVNDRKSVSIDLDFNFSDPIILEVFSEKHIKNSIPFDRLILKPNTKKVRVSVPKGRVKVQFKDSKNKIIHEIKINQ